VEHGVKGAFDIEKAFKKAGNSVLCRVRVVQYASGHICMARVNDQKQGNGSALGFEAQLWAAADKMRGHMDASEYNHVVLGLNPY
jgi:hypothetical protein